MVLYAQKCVTRSCVYVCVFAFKALGIVYRSPEGGVFFVCECVLLHL